ncbi:MAG: MFS transporter [Bacilli bacterium]|nr:MFS transporter [Bacilli bacterium]
MKLNVKKTIYVGLAFLIISMFWQVYDNVIAKIVIDSFGLGHGLSGVVLALDNVFALFLLPLFGRISDKTKTRYGRRTPFIVVGVILSALLFIGVGLTHAAQVKMIQDNGIEEVVEIKDEDDELIGYSYEGVDYEVDQYEDALELRRAHVWAISQNNTVYLFLFVGILFVVLFIMATYRTPAVAFMPDVTPKPLRSKANAIINLMGAAGGIIAIIFLAVVNMVKGGMGISENSSYVIEFVVLAVLMIGLLVIFIWKVKEPKLVQENQELIEKYGVDQVETIQEETASDMSPAVRKSFFLILGSIVFWFMAYNAATSKFSVYAGDVLQMGYFLPLLIAQGAAIIAFIPIGIIASKVGRKKTILVGIIILAAAFLLGSLANYNTTFLIYVTMAMAGIGWATINVNSYPMVVEMSKGANIGKYTGYYYSASMLAQIVTPILSGYLMENINTRVLFPYSVLFCVLAFVTMSLVKHGDSKPIPVKDKLEAFEAMED